MKNVRRFTRIFALGLGLVGVRAQAQVVTLAELEKRALQVGVFVDGHDARSRGAEAQLRQTAAAYYPQVVLRAETSLQPGRQLVRVCQAGDANCNDADNNREYLVSGARALGQDNAFAVQPITRLEISANAPVYDFGRTKAAVRAGRFSHDAIRAERDADAEAVVRNVRATYLNWLSAHELAKVTESAARDAEDRHTRIAALVEQGARPKVELGSAQSDALLTKLEVTRARGDVGRALRALEGVLGEPLFQGAAPDPSLLESDAEMAAFSAAADAVERVLDRQRAAAHALELSYKRQRRPQFGISVLAGTRVQKSQGDVSVFPMYGAALTFLAPLYDGGIAKAAAAGARAQADALEAQIREHTREQERARDDAMQSAVQAREVLVFAVELRTLALKRLEDAQAGYDLGVNGIEKIAEARSLLRRAETEVLMAKVSAAEARLRVAPVNLDAR